MFQITWLDNFNLPIKKNIETTLERLSDGKRKNTKSKIQMKMRRQMHNTSITCEAQNSAEKSPSKTSILLQIEFAPYVTLETSSVALKEGESVLFSCIAEANPTEVTYHWSVEGEEQDDAEERFVISRVTRQDNGKIVKCRVKNRVGISEDTHILNIHCKIYTSMRKNT